MRFVEQAPSLYTLSSTIALPGFVLPLTSAIARVQEGLVVLSPLPGIEQQREELERHGRVAALVSTSLLHHLGLPGAKAAFPEARVYALRGLEKKRPDVAVDAFLDDDVPSPLGDELLHLVVRGLRPGHEELAFFHRPTRTLVLADLCFHINESAHWATPIVMKLNGAWRRFGPSRLMKSIITDRAALRGSVERMLAWDPERIVVAHGDVVERDGRARLEEAFAFLR